MDVRTTSPYMHAVSPGRAGQAIDIYKHPWLGLGQGKDYKYVFISFGQGEPVWPEVGKRKDLGSIPLRLSFLFRKVVVCGHRLATVPHN